MPRNHETVSHFLLSTAGKEGNDRGRKDLRREIGNTYLYARSPHTLRALQANLVEAFSQLKFLLPCVSLTKTNKQKTQKNKKTNQYKEALTEFRSSLSSKKPRSRGGGEGLPARDDIHLFVLAVGAFRENQIWGVGVIKRVLCNREVHEPDNIWKFPGEKSRLVRSSWILEDSALGNTGRMRIGCALRSRG